MATKAPSKNIASSTGGAAPRRHAALVEGFPALKKLGFATGKRSVPFVQQLEWTDCGAASLCMVMAYYGREAKLAEVREAMGIGRDGVSAKSILDTAERYGLTGRCIKVKREKGRLTRYVQELMSEKGLFSRIVVVSLALRLIGLGMPLLTGMIIDRVVPRADYDLLYVCLATIAGMVVFNLIADVVRMYLLLHLRISLDTRMTLGFLDHMVSREIRRCRS